MTTPDYVPTNQISWASEAPWYRELGRRHWEGEPSWGIWGIPEAELKLLPDVAGLDVLDDGCGTGYVSAWLARLGGKPVGLDPTPEQLESARLFQDEFNLRFPLIQGIAEALPFADECFDLVISEYGAAIWSDPYRWIPEAARVLRPGGQLIFLGNHPIVVMCAFEDEEVPAENVLQRAYFELHRLEWPVPEGELPSVEFHLPHGEWIRLFRKHGFEVEDLIEVQAPADATTAYPWVTAEWANRWPSEEVWKARKRF